MAATAAAGERFAAPPQPRPGGGRLAHASSYPVKRIAHGVLSA
jgi:hypothetical protein